VLAVGGDEPVLLGEGRRRADLGTLLARQRGGGAHPALALEAHRPLVEVAGEPHVTVHPDQLLVVQVRDRRAVDDAAVLVEDPHLLVGVPLERAHTSLRSMVGTAARGGIVFT